MRCRHFKQHISHQYTNADEKIIRRVNGDGVISRADAEMTSEAVVGTVTLDKYQTIAADVNGDGMVDVKDSTLILKLLTGAITGFPVGECFYY